jgi:hypothetical protein
VRVEIDIRRPRWLPSRVSRRWKVLGALAVLALVGTPVGVLANHRFPDVLPGSGHTEVSKVADAGIARGCGNSGNFCPGNPVTRLQMAQFVSRAGGSATAKKLPLSGFELTTDPQTALFIDVVVPGLAGNEQLVKVEADVVVRAPSTALCVCEASFFLQDDNNPSTQFSATHFVTLTDPEPTTGARADVPVSLSYVFTAESGTTQRFHLTGETTGGSEDLFVYGDMTATTYPSSN